MKEINIVGKNLTPENIKDVKKYITNQREICAKPLHEEQEKSPEILKLIESINTYISEELKELGIEKTIIIDHSQIHLLPHKIFKEKFPEANTIAIYLKIDNQIFLDFQCDKIYLFDALLHEAIHLNSHQKILLNKDINHIDVYRSGYRIKNLNKNHEHYLEFNEAVTEKIKNDIIKKHFAQIIKDNGISLQEERHYLNNYTNYEEFISVLNNIIKEVSKNKNENAQEIWFKIKRGYFTGEMMHLRTIKKHYDEDLLDTIGK